MRDDEIVDALNDDEEFDDRAGPAQAAEASASSDEPYIELQVETYGGPTRFPREAAARIQALSPAEFAAWQQERYKARTDTLWCGNNLMGLSLSENPHRVYAHFMPRKQPGVDIGNIDPATKKRILLASRGTAKTHFVRAEEMCWLLCYPNIRLVFLSGSEQVSVPQAEALKRAFSRPNKKMVELFPEYVLKSVWDKPSKRWKDVPVSDWGTQHSWTVPCRTNLSIPEASFTIATPESVSSGIHADVIFVDDLQNNSNSKTDAAIVKTKKLYLDVLPLLMPEGQLILTGTRYKGGSPQDVYGQIMEQASAESRWKFLVLGAKSTTCTNCRHPKCFHDFSVNAVQPPGLIPGYECVGFVSDGIEVPFCPVVKCADGTQYGHTLEYLATMEAEDFAFYCLQYENNPGLIDAAIISVFTEALIGQQTFHDLNWLEERCPRILSKRYAAVDLAYTTTLRADNSVIYIFSVFQGQIFVWHCIFGKWNASTRIATLTDTLVDHRFRPIRTMYIEDNLNSDSTKMLLETSCRDRGIAVFPVQFLPTSRAKDAKIIRIGDIEQVLRARRLWLYSGMPGYDILVKQLLVHPNQYQSHDDLADGLGIVCQCPTNFLAETAPLTPRAGTPDNPNGLTWLQRLNRPQEPELLPGQNDGTSFCW